MGEWIRFSIPSINMDIKDIYYLAGLLEGEGCFGFRSRTPQIQLKMTDLDTVMKARDLMSPGRKISTQKHENPNHKDSYAFMIFGDPAISWMMTIYSLMSVRRKAKIRETITRWKAMTGNSIEGMMKWREEKYGVGQESVLAHQIAKLHNIPLEEAREFVKMKFIDGQS